MTTRLSKPFLFIHIRKTGGVSLRALLANQFPANRTLVPAHSASGPRRPNDALFASGHVSFDYTKHFKVRPTIFTVLREPVARAISAYYFFRSNDDDFFRRLATELTDFEYESRRRFTDRAQHMEMQRFLVEEEPLARYWLSNVQVRQLAGDCIADLSDNDPRLLEAAVTHLAQCDLAGVVERSDDTLRLLGHVMNWGRLGPLQHLNRTVWPKTPDIDPRCADILRSWNSLDLCLYREACHLFERKLEVLGDRSQDNADRGITCLPDGEQFTPDKAIVGYGWHEREFHQDKWLCWNSAATATLDLSLSKMRSSTFRCLLTHVVSQAALDKLQISLNSVRLSLRKREAEGGILLESAIPEGALEANPYRARLTFDCPVMLRPCDINPNSADSRRLSIAIGWIRID